MRGLLICGIVFFRERCSRYDSACVHAHTRTHTHEQLHMHMLLVSLTNLHACSVSVFFFCVCVVFFPSFFFFTLLLRHTTALAFSDATAQSMGVISEAEEELRSASSLGDAHMCIVVETHR